MGLIKRIRRGRRPAETDTLSQPLMQISKRDFWTIGDACEGTQIFGSTGSGKSSGSGQYLAKAMLRAGFGGLVLTAKPEERETWERYCREVNREPPLIFTPGGPYRFNFMDYEFQAAPGIGLTQNLINLFQEVLDATNASNQRANDEFWTNALQQLMRDAIDLVIGGAGSVSLEAIARVVESAPRSRADFSDDTWRDTSFCFRMIEAGDQAAANGRDFDKAARYFYQEFPEIAEKTRSIIIAMFTGMADYFLRGEMYELFCTDTTITPEDTHDGRIIVIDLPLKTYYTVGRYAQLLWKYIWQRAAERRTGSNLRPIFLWADEAQFFITKKDVDFQSTARNKLAATVYLTQNISNYQNALGNNNAATESILASLRTKIFHANDGPTNDWAEKLIAKDWQTRANSNNSQDEKNRSRISVGASQSLDSRVLAKEFGSLRCGGPLNDFIVDAIFFKAGKPLSSGLPTAKVMFSQLS